MDNVGRTCGTHETGRNIILGISKFQRTHWRNRIRRENNSKINTKPEKMRMKITVISFSIRKNVAIF